MLNSYRQPMMKIQVNDVGDRLILEVEGRLAGVFVPELEHCWHSALAIRPDRTIVVDLKHVTCVDRAGRSLLQSMHCGGVVFMRAGIAIQDILEQVIQEQECKQH
jgi:anti-anti-sigma regulatory factor